MAIGRFSKEFIERVRERNNISDVIGEYIPIQKKQGNRHWACCPFHTEKTPSFSISPEKGLYYCFGCKESGDVFAFVEKYENCSFPEAVEKLAERVHLPIPTDEMSEEEKRRDAYRKRLLEACELATEYFHNCLTKTKMGLVGLEYWKKRGISAQTIIDFKLGFSPPDWDRLYRDFRKRGFSKKVLVDAGLCIEKEKSVYDRFRNRCMFPIRDQKGRPVAFGGRVLENEDRGAKYLNSPETPIFNKSKILFALERAASSIREQQLAVLVEGYMDVVSVHNQGVTNVVASLGTAFTEEQARILRRWTSEVVVAYDMDRAGRDATRRVIEIARKANLRIRVVTMPNGKDPDDYIRTQGVEAWHEVIRMAQDVLDYRLDDSVRTHDITTIEGKNAVLAEMIPLIIETENNVAVDSYLSRLAKRLRLDERVVRSEATQFVEEHRRNVYIAEVTAETKQEGTETNEEARLRRTEEQAIRYLLEMRPGAEELITLLNDEDFSDSLCNKLYRRIKNQFQQGEKTDIHELGFDLNEEEQNRLQRIAMESYIFSDDIKEIYIKPLRRASLQRRYDEHCRRAEEHDRQGNKDGYEEEMLAGMKVQVAMREWE